jgi:hypothetical protein
MYVRKRIRKTAQSGLFNNRVRKGLRKALRDAQRPFGALSQVFLTDSPAKAVKRLYAPLRAFLAAEERGMEHGDPAVFVFYLSQEIVLLPLLEGLKHITGGEEKHLHPAAVILSEQPKRPFAAEAPSVTYQKNFCFDKSAFFVVQSAYLLDISAVLLAPRIVIEHIPQPKKAELFQQFSLFGSEALQLRDI